MGKIIDKNGRLFGLISIIDVLVILVVIVMAVALHLKSNVLTTTSTSVTMQEVTFVAEAEHVPDFIAAAIRVGDTVYDKDQATGGAIGVITDVQLLPANKNMELKDGTIAETGAEEYCNVVVTVTGQALVDDNGRYRFNRVYEIGVNASRNFYTKYAAFLINVTDMW